MKSLIRNPRFEVAAGIFVLATLSFTWTHITQKVAEATPECAKGTCKVPLPNTQGHRLGTICDLADQSDTLMVSCIFDHDDPNDKMECYKGVHILDAEVSELQQSYKSDFGVFPICPNTFRSKWREGK